MRGEGWQVDYTLVSDTQVASYLATPSVDLHRNMTAIFYQSISLREWRNTKKGRNSSFYEYHIPHRCTLVFLNNTSTETRAIFVMAFLLKQFFLVVASCMEEQLILVAAWESHWVSTLSIQLLLIRGHVKDARVRNKDGRLTVVTPSTRRLKPKQ